MKSFALFLLTCASLARAASQAAAPVVDLGYASYQGSFNATSNTTSFLGLRYAKPPLGDLRWRAPVAPDKVNGVQVANTIPPECLQPPDGTGTNPINPLRPNFAKRAVSNDEDCLFLNVFTPGRLNPNAKLPVVFYIHGGGYVGGGTAGNPGQDFIPESGFGVVSVIIQYRLGMFGFLSGTDVKNDGSLNAGLLDQEFALKWAQQHIAAFGGDPTKVTIWGQSAGAGSVLQQVVAHGGKTNPPLFRAAMTSSTFLPFQYNFNDTVPEALFAQAALLTNCTGTQDTMACLRAQDSSVLEAVNTQITLAGFFGTFVWVPVVDGSFILERPTVSLSNGRVNGERVLSITNSFEGSIFVNDSQVGTLPQYIFELFPLLTEDEVNAAVKQYAEFDSAVDAAIAVQGESIFICPTYFLLKAFQGRSNKGEYAVPPGSHGEEFGDYFPSTGGPDFPNPAFVAAFVDSFFSVARFLDPNDKFQADIKPNWPVYADGNTEMLFNRTEAGQPVVHTITTDPGLLERCAFWESISPLTHQ